MGKILPMTNAAVFKKVFTHPDCRDALKDMIASFTGLSLKSAEPKNTDSLRLDVDCVDDNGELVGVGIEMLSEYREDILKRSVFNLAKAHSSRKNQKTFHLIFCNFILFKDRKSYVNHFNFRNENGELLSDDVNICFVELAKLDGLLLKNQP
jgi:hypothetical protein